jgi:hypothetical protein
MTFPKNAVPKKIIGRTEDSPGPLEHMQNLILTIINPEGTILVRKWALGYFYLVH